MRFPREGESFAPTLRGETEQAREQAIVSQGAWSLQRAVRLDKWIGEMRAKAESGVDPF